MFLSIHQIMQAIKHLAEVKPFYGTAFLVFKAAKLPIETTKSYPSLYSEMIQFFDQFYKPDPTTTYYFHACRAPRRNHYWIEENYPTQGRSLDKTIQTTFREAFIHPRYTPNLWGWQKDYVSRLKAELHRRKPIPAFYLAVWLYRDRAWPAETKPENIKQTFIDEFHLTKEELQELFDTSVPKISEDQPLLQSDPVSWNIVMSRLNIPLPPDAPAEKGQALVYLALRGVGPAKELAFNPAERLSLITGDNGLGKTFLLETAWWALTGQWAGLPAYPRPDAKRNEPRIIFQILGESNKVNEVSVTYNWETQSWPLRGKRQTIPGLLIYARVDGSFAVWDPLKNYWTSTDDKTSDISGRVFAREELWNGLDASTNGKTVTIINGLLRDWVMWQNTPGRYPFEAFKQVLTCLSPPNQSDLDILEPGLPVRLPGDNKEIPTLKHPYGEVPIVHAAAGVRRIVTLAYLMVWAWNEHKIEAKNARRDPDRRLVILIDEIEAHLHPQWQRRILPALLEVGEALDPNIQLQFLVATHSPLVTASIEPKFDPEIDKLFHLDIEQHNLIERNAVLRELPFVRYGPVDTWLMSDVFELRQARSLEAEEAIEDAKVLQLQDQPQPEEVQEVTNRLVEYLSAHDEFWPRWKYFAEQHGVDL